MPAISASAAITITSATTSAQPLSQPVRGPNAFAAHVKLVPQSGVLALSDLYAYEMNSIGRNASNMMIGDLSPTVWATPPRVAARLYPGAVDATPMTTLESRPIAPSLSPFCATV